jgi:DNA polymerase delta subunit 1
VKKTVHEGILPMIETELLAARKRAKKQMAEATDPLTRSVFDGKQYVF